MVTIKTIIQKYKAKEITKDQALDLLDQAKAQTAVGPTLTTPKPEILADAIKQYLARKLGHVLAIEAGEISATKNFMDLGIDSIQLITLVRDIEAEIGIELYPTLLFEHQNADTLSLFMAQEYRDEFSAFLKIDAEPKHAEPIHSPLNPQREQPLTASVSTNGRLKTQPDQVLGPINQAETLGDIAVIGMAGVFPKSSNIARFWQNLYQKTNLITEIPTDHFDYKPWYDPQARGEDKMYCKWGGFIDDVDKFDAAFFNISPREAALMDPQLRYLLQVLYHTAEDAGYGPNIRSTNTGVYVGVCSHDYAQEMTRQGKKVQAHDGTGNAATMLANRPSFYFNLTGPSLALDSACSSSLYALHAAYQALRAGECEMAFAAGTNMLLSSVHYRYFCSIGALSPSGRCHTFDKRADGYVPGETVAAVLLKPLRKAVQDGDHIYGVMKGSAVRHGGYTPSITAPSVDGEANVLLSAWRAADLNPETLGYIEAHGTGTQLGDPVEIEALQKAFRTYTHRTGFCAIGSAKAHIGHAEGAAGIVGFIKTLLSMQHGIIPAMPDFEALNPYINLERSPFYINREPVAWPRKDDLPRRAGVSSFGFGGAYAHVVVEEYQEVEAKDEEAERRPQIIVLSAKHEDRLRAYAQKMLAYLEQDPLLVSAGGEADSIRHPPALTQAVQEMTAAMIGVAPSEIEIEQPFEGYGLDPVQLSRLKRMVEDHYDCELPANLFSGSVSAKNIAQHLAALETEDARGEEHKASQSTLYLARLAYTLQVGREAMPVRLAMVVADVDTLREKLAAYLAGADNVEHLYQARITSQQQYGSIFAQDEDLQEAVNQWIRKGKLAKLAELWVAGVDIDWNLMYPHATPRRVSLPTYPFAKERYWLPNNEECRMENKELCNPHSQFTTAPLHPLIHRNISDLAEQRYSTVFTGSEFFLDDHRVRGEKVLPGVAYLEMARNAGTMAIREQDVTQLKDVVWVRPLVVKDKPLETQIGLYPAENGEIAFAISSSEVIHSQGKLVVGSMDHPQALDISAIQARCLSTLEGATCYAHFKERGLSYGPSFQGLVQLSYNEREVLARLRLPMGVEKTGYGLHPSVLDAALQATAGLGLSRDSQGPRQLALPFAMQTVDIYDVLPENAWAYVQFSAEGETTGDVTSYDITVANDKGEACVVLQGFKVKAFVDPVEIGLLYSKPIWKTKSLVEHNEKERAESEAKSLLLVGVEQDVVEAITATFDQATVMVLDSTNATELVRHSWRCVKTIVENQPRSPHTLVVVAADTVEPHRYAPLAGLLKTVRLEQPTIRSKIITVANPQSDDLISLLDRELRSHSFPEIEIRYDAAGSRTVKSLQEIEIEINAQEKKLYLRPGGVYWITGGLGGLGRIFARHLLDQGEQITVILSGRSAIDAAGEQYLADLNRANGSAIYLPVDMSVRADVDQAVQTIITEHGVLNGIIHTAGVIVDSLITNKTEAEIEAVLAPKVAGILNIDAATQAEMLDFMVLFSSLVGTLGNIGQADYAAANAFLDSFAYHRQALVESGERAGRTLSINWPMWAEGGMAIDAASQTMLTSQTGLMPLPTEIGLQAFETLMTSTERQVLVANGKVDKIRRSLLSPDSEMSTPKTDVKLAVGERAELAEKIQTDLIKSVSHILKINVEDIAGDENLSEYGFDSITLTELGNNLNEAYGLTLLPTVFFEHTTLLSLSRYLAEYYPDQVAGYYPNKPVPGPMSPPQQTPAPTISAKERFRSTPSHEPMHRRPPQAEAIAIIGMSGRLPGSPDLTAFWQHLAAGHDLVSEIPGERWDWRSYDGDPFVEANKTKSRWGGFIADVDKFDAGFFKISPHEAALMDPQQRLWLETVWHCIEDAGYRSGRLAGTRTGIFVGVASHEYEELVRRHRTTVEAHSATGLSHSVLANRISYLLDLHGPSEPIDTACSSSLVAIHRAVEALHSGSCEMAIVGGVNLLLTPSAYLAFSQAGMLAEDGRCKTFDKRANGYVRAEGVGAIFLKPLAQAEADGDHIYAVIRGTAENHGGQATSLTAPNPKAQADLLVSAYQQANIDPTTVGYIEAHGTGTALGDPIEINGLKQAFSTLYQHWQHTGPVQPHCGLGSVKTNIGHLETAAGIAGVLKVLLALQYQTLPATIHFEEQNPYIDLTDSPFYVVSETQAWPAVNDEAGQAIPRRAGVSSFGFGGANAHIVLEEYQPKTGVRSKAQDVGAGQPQVILLSARNKERLKVYVQKVRDYLVDRSDVTLTELAYTLQVGREAMESRLACVVDDVPTLRETLTAYLAGEADKGHVYSGQLHNEQKKAHLFAQDEDLQDTVSRWISKGKLDQLAQLWVTGVEIEWALLYGANKPRRLVLPTYPFARERHWVTDDDPRREHSSRPQSGAMVDGARQHRPEVHSMLSEAVNRIAAGSTALLPDEQTLSQEQAGFEALERFARTALLNGFQQGGVLQHAAERYDSPALAHRLKVLPQFQRLFHALIALLEQSGYISLNGDEIETTVRVDQLETQQSLKTLSQQRDQLQETYPTLEPYLTLLEICLQSLLPIVQGQVPATEIIFPQSSLALVEGVYHGTPLTNYFNRLTALAVKSWLEQRRPALSPGEKISVVEIGAGTGSTTAFVLEAIMPYRDDIEYHYTDISAGFTLYGQAHFGDDYPFIKFGPLDVEKEPLNQGYELKQADIVLGANVVHATKNIRQTLQNLKLLLKPNGLLILNEVTCFQAFVTLTFGLLDGWWLFEDEENRIEHAPLLSVEQWRQMLTAEGFTGLTHFGLPVLAPDAQPQAVIIAQSDGLLALRKSTAALSSPPGPSPERAVDPEAVEQLESYIQQQILDQVARATGVLHQQLDPNRSLAEYGVDSITGIKLVHNLNQVFDLQLQTAALLGYPDIRSLAHYLYREYGDEIRQRWPDPVAAEEGKDGPLPEPERRVEATGDSPTTITPAYSPLVPIQSTGTRPPFFCVHPWAGVVYPYYELAAELGPDQPFYGLQAVGLYQQPHTTIEAMADHYLTALRRVQPEPPYLLGGWSMGGLIAFEMAQQLQQAGEAVTLLALFDVPAPVDGLYTRTTPWGKFLMMQAGPYIWPYVHDYFRLKASLQDLTTAPSDAIDTANAASSLNSWQMGRVVTKEIWSLTSAQSTPRRIFNILRVGRQAMARYQPQRYPGQVTLFRVQSALGQDDQSRTLGWQVLTEQEVVVHHLPGHHLNLMKKPQVQMLANTLKRCLKSSEASSDAERSRI